MADAVAMRAVLAAYLGAERYREFVRQTSRFSRGAGRLRFWQEEAWAEFTRLHPQFAVPFDRLCEALRVCWVHGCELELVARVVHAPGVHISYDREYERVWGTLFPYSPPQLAESGWPFPAVLAEVESCPECVRARATWERQHAEPGAAADGGT